MIILLTLGKSNIDSHFADFETAEICGHFSDFWRVKNWWVLFPLILILGEKKCKNFL